MPTNYYYANVTYHLLGLTLKICNIIYVNANYSSLRLSTLQRKFGFDAKTAFVAAQNLGKTRSDTFRLTPPPPDDDIWKRPAPDFRPQVCYCIIVDAPVFILCIRKHYPRPNLRHSGNKTIYLHRLLLFTNNNVQFSENIKHYLTLFSFRIL